MTSSEVLYLFRRIGFDIDLRVLTKFTDYISSMMKDDRVLIIYENGEPYALLLYSITNNHIPYLLKSDWTYLEHDPDGSTIYIEKLISKGWNKELRQEFERKILERHPQLTDAVWHKWAEWGDRQVTIKRRLQYV